MATSGRRPGISRQDRISEEGLDRLEKQLQRGARMAAQVRQQWVRRYGQAAIELFEKYEYDPDEGQLAVDA